VQTASLAAIVALALAAATASPAPGAQGHRLLLGLLGDPDRFDRQTGQRSRVRLIIARWGQGVSWGSRFPALFATMREIPMLGISTGDTPATEEISPRDIALGRGDGYLVELNRAVHEWGRSIYLRPLAEMNGHWNPYSAFNSDGSARDAAHSTVWFRKAFARIYLLVHGGPKVNARLRRLGLPPVGGELASNPHVRVVWNPQGYGSPNLSGNSARSYYPGDAYVDVVANDLYDIRFRAAWEALEALYRDFPRKPFAIGEWGLWGIDDPEFVERMAAFLRTHPRVEFAVYNTGRAGRIFDIATKPRSLAAYRRLIAPLGR
jgi:hypothetical protein